MSGILTTKLTTLNIFLCEGPLRFGLSAICIVSGYLVTYLNTVPF